MAFNTPQMVEVLEQFAKATAGTAINKISWTGRWIEPLGAFASGQGGDAERALGGVFLPEGPGGLDQPGYAGRGGAAGQLVGADAARLRRFPRAPKIPIWPGLSSNSCTAKKQAQAMADSRRVLTAYTEVDK